jgi:hypothetical protein
MHTTLLCCCHLCSLVLTYHLSWAVLLVPGIRRCLAPELPLPAVCLRLAVVQELHSWQMQARLQLCRWRRQPASTKPGSCWQHTLTTIWSSTPCQTPFPGPGTLIM